MANPMLLPVLQARRLRYPTLFKLQRACSC